jgi:hypothetical protein
MLMMYFYKEQIHDCKCTFIFKKFWKAPPVEIYSEEKFSGKCF